MNVVVCYTAVFSVVTQHSSPGGTLRDDTKKGCVADYERQGQEPNNVIKSIEKTLNNTHTNTHKWTNQDTPHKTSFNAVTPQRLLNQPFCVKKILSIGNLPFNLH